VTVDPRPSRLFVSDNAAGIPPALMAAIAAANRGHAPAYGHDPWTEAATARVRDAFGGAAEVLFVFGGTGANAVGLRPFIDSYQAVICAASSHLWLDECGAPERFLGAKLVPVPSPDGKLTPTAVEPFLRGFGVVHHVQPGAISVAQPTEWGTVYTPEELRALGDLAHAHNMVLHVDGARLSNAAAALDLPLGAFGAAAGVDVLTFGGTKNGLLGGEAVILFDAGQAARAAFFRKQGMQLASKMRFIAAQFEALLTDPLWHRLAANANAMARLLGDGLADLPGTQVIHPVQTNVVFVAMAPAAMAALQARHPFHTWDQARSIGRIMTAWDTEPDDVTGFLEAAHEVLSAP